MYRAVERMIGGLHAGIVALTFITVSGLLGGCSTDPLGGSNLNLLSRDEEIQLGTEGYQQIVAQYGVYDDDPALSARVDSIGKALAAISDDPSWPYRFTILDATEVNAFALPGGPVFVTRGLLAYVQNDAQLAVVLGHEIGHVVEHHTARQYSSAQLTNLAVGLGSVFLPQVQPYLGAVQVGLQLLFLKYSRDDERQSDELGVKYATKAGYQTSDAGRFFESLKRIQTQAGVTLPEWQSTHPDPGDRQQTIVSLTSKYQGEYGEQQYGGLDSSRYLPLVQNIVFGENPRHGFVSGSVFYHPDLQFQMPVPSGWRVDNFASEVQMTPNTESPNAAIVLTTAGSASPVDAANQFVSQNNATVVANGAVTVNGLQAYRLISTINVDDGQGGTAVLEALSYFISKDGVLYVMHGYTTQASFSSYQSTFESVGQGFARVTNSSVLNVQPYRLQVFQAPRTDVFDNLVKLNANVGLSSVEDVAILNEKVQGQQIAAGAYLKQVP